MSSLQPSGGFRSHSFSSDCKHIAFSAKSLLFAIGYCPILLCSGTRLWYSHRLPDSEALPSSSGYLTIEGLPCEISRCFSDPTSPEFYA